MILATLTVASAAFLAFANGANDVSKGVATLAGSRRTSYRTAIAWGTFWTFAGGAASLVIAVGLVNAAAAMTIWSYTAGLRVTRTLGERVVHMHQDKGLAVSVVASALVLAASFYTLPVSTTHVSTGAIVGAGVRQGNGAVEWRNVGSLVFAWVGTLPIAGALAATIWMIVSA